MGFGLRTVTNNDSIIKQRGVCLQGDIDFASAADADFFLPEADVREDQDVVITAYGKGIAPVQIRGGAVGGAFYHDGHADQRTVRV